MSKENGGKIVKDPEMKALASITKLLDELTPEARLRVLVFLKSRYDLIDPRPV